MPREQMNAQQVAEYLHMDVREVTKLASRGQIPCRKIGGTYRFRKGDIDHWVEQQMHELAPERLERIERGVSRHHGYEHEELLVWPMIPSNGVAAPLLAKTREAALRALVKLGEDAGLVYARDELLDEIRQREELCPTSFFPGVALPHPRHPVPYDIAESFVIVGLTPSGVPFGAEDGSLTRLFFLTCCKDERTHLHVLARLARMLHEKGAVESLMAAEDPGELSERLHELEQAVVA